ncbi:MAG: flagellar hook-basal body complex protein FliE [Phycisphaerales bacterium]
MTDPLGLIGSASRVGPVGPGAAPMAQPAADPNTPAFKDLLLKNLEEANKLQQDATAAVEDLQTGKRTDLEGVLLATAKADTAFKMIQAVRNQVVRAYEEIQQMRV